MIFPSRRLLGAGVAFCLTVSAAPWTVIELPFRLANGESARKPLPATMPGGFAVFDFDNDGRLDLFVTNGGELPSGRKTGPAHSNRLFRNLGGLRFEDVTAKSGLAGSEYAFGVSAADFDNDGFVDLAVGNLRSVTVYRNNGNGTFSDITARAGIDNGKRWTVAPAWLDADGDGRLDLFLGNYVRWDPATERECLVAGKPDFCHPRFYDPSPSALFHNNGDGTFSGVSAASGIAAKPGKAMSVAVADFNGDGRVDLFVTNDRVFNHLWINQGGGRFAELAFDWNVAVVADGNPVSAMGVDAQDYDNDGLPDLIYTALRDETFPLYRNRAGKGFDEVTALSRVGILTRPMAGWGAVMADLDNDGWKDLVFARSDALSASGGKGAAAKEPPSWLRNLRNGKFAIGAGWEALPPEMYRGALAADLDNDGCLDIVLTALNAPARILRNPCPAGPHWLAVAAPVPGTRVRVGTQWRTAAASTGYASSNVGPLHFGLGAAVSVDVEIIPPGGAKRVLRNTAANQTLR